MTENNKLSLPTQKDLDEGIYLPELTSEQTDWIFKQMEEYANAPKEPIGTRTPGERGMYEIQRRENVERRFRENENGVN